MDSQIREWFSLAMRVAKGSLCLRANCGAILVKNGEIIGSGYNGPPKNDLTLRVCLSTQPSKAKPKTDRTCCLHAEWQALLGALQTRPMDVQGSTMVFCRVDYHGGLLKSGKPYCTVCSRLTLDWGVSSWFLWHESGVQEYSTLEYHQLSERYGLTE